MGVAHEIEQACRLAKALRPEVVAVDMALNERILQEFFTTTGTCAFNCRFVLFNAKVDHSSLRAALQAGVSGYLAADASVADLVAALEKVSGGPVFFSTSVARLIQSDYVERAPCPCRSCPTPLSARERAVLEERSRGRRIKEIASDLGLSSRSVEKHLENSARKSGRAN